VSGLARGVVRVRRAAAALAATGIAALLSTTVAPAAFASGDAERLALGRSLFTAGAEPACGVCHTLADAGAQGSVGPSLDELQPDAGQVERALRTGVGVMPSYAQTLSDAQRQALAAYVAAASRVRAR